MANDQEASGCLELDSEKISALIKTREPDFIRLGLCHHACRKMHSDTAHILFHEFDLAGM
jgi:hypothetical protein